MENIDFSIFPKLLKTFLEVIRGTRGLRAGAGKPSGDLCKQPVFEVAVFFHSAVRCIPRRCASRLRFRTMSSVQVSRLDG